jgi:hypothetical protein
MSIAVLMLTCEPQASLEARAQAGASFEAQRLCRFTPQDEAEALGRDDEKAR